MLTFRRAFFAFLPALCICGSCQTEGTSVESAGTVSVHAEAHQVAEPGKVLRFKRQALKDTEGFGYEVFTILVPEEWSFQGDVDWEFVQGIPRGMFSYRISSPDGNSLVEGFPEQSFQWTSDPMLLRAYQQGGIRIMEPVGIEGYIEQVFLPSRRPGASAVRLVETRPQPELAGSWKKLQEYLIMRVYQPISPLPFVPEFSADAAVVDLEYERGGGHWFESCLVVITGSTFFLPGMYGAALNRPWTVQVTTFRTTEAGAAEQKELFSIMMRSASTNPRWGVDATRLIATVTREQLQAQQAVFRRMQQIARTQSEISDMIVDSYERRDLVMDKVFENYSEVTRGVDSYTDPINSMKVELPAGYDNAWTNGSEYVFSESPGFDPNLSAAGDWVRMNRAER